MMKKRLFYYLVALCYFCSCNQVIAPEKNNMGDDATEMEDYYELCAATNQFVFGELSGLKAYSFNEAAIAEVVGHRLINAKITKLKTDFSVDTVYTAVKDSTFGFSPTMQSAESSSLSQNYYSWEKAYLGKTNNKEYGMVLAFEGVTYTQNHVYLSEAFYGIPVCEPSDIFKAMPPTTADSISIYNTLMTNGVATNKLKSMVMQGKKHRGGVMQKVKI